MSLVVDSRVDSHLGSFFLNSKKGGGIQIYPLVHQREENYDLVPTLQSIQGDGLILDPEDWSSVL
jgi:hypothetical protein